MIHHALKAYIVAESAMRLHMALVAGFLLIACERGEHTPSVDTQRQNARPASDVQSETARAPASPSPVMPPAALDWSRADSLALRLPPDLFPALPELVRADMKRRGCTVPQSPALEERHNVIFGAFIRPGQTDWAVLCSIDRVSRILVYRAGTPDVVDSLGHAEDLGYLQTVGGDTIGFSRRIDTADRQYIESHAAAHGGATPPPIDHLGINDIFMGKASQVHYLYRGKWIRLQGAD